MTYEKSLHGMNWFTVGNTFAQKYKSNMFTTVREASYSALKRDCVRAHWHPIRSSTIFQVNFTKIKDL